MFTGIIESIGTIQSVRKGQKAATLEIASSLIVSDLKQGDSVAVNGVCLSVTWFDNHSFTVDAVPETMNRSNLNRLKIGSQVNLERALRVGDRLGGHMVSGHVDTQGILAGTEKDENAVWFTVKANQAMMKYVVEKGSVALDGVSLTVVKTGTDWFTVSMIPITLKETTLGTKKTGDALNIEWDMTAKYLEKLMFAQKQSEDQINMDFLYKNGFA